MATTSDPTTNNLVTFNPNPVDATAYNNFLMEESYLLVPTNGLTAAKANALAQVVRFAVGSQGQQIISQFGAAPDTAAMAAAGQSVAATLNAEAVSTAASGSSTTTTTAVGSEASTTTVTTPGASTSGGPGGTAGTDPSATDQSGSGLAFTGTSNLPAWIGSGASLLIAGTLIRRRLRRKEIRP